jgi:hypothetical protein
VFAHGLYSIWEAIHRAGVIYAYLREDGSGRIRRSSLYDALDRSEKAAASYYIGMTMTKVIAARLGVHWLMHVDRYYHTLQIAFAGRMRPDLIGPDTQQRWLVAEAKGRTGGEDQVALSKMQLQKRSISRVGNSRPHLAIGCLAFFEDDGLSLRVIDPDDDEPNPVSHAFDIDSFLWAYYQPFVQWFTGPGSEPTAGGNVTLRLAEIDANVSISRELLAVAQQPRGSRGIAESITAIASRTEDDPNQYGDGLTIELGGAWEGEARRLE